MSRFMTITLHGKSVRFDIDTVVKIVIVPISKNRNGTVKVCIVDEGFQYCEENLHKIENMPYLLENSLDDAINLSNYILNHLIADGAKHFKDVA